MAKEGRIRRSKKDVLTSKIETIDNKITELNAKIESLASEKEDCLAQLKELELAENKAKEEAEFKEIRALIKKKKISLDDLRDMIERNASSEEGETEEYESGE